MGSLEQISTDIMDQVVELKGILEVLITESKKAEMCLKCRKGLHKELECYATNLISTTIVPKKSEVP